MLKVNTICGTLFPFSLFFLICITQAYASEAEWIQGMPKHHTTEGFRNYPIVEEAPSLGFSFYFHRFISSFSSPDVPKSHVLIEEKAIALYKELNERNTVTWIGQSTLLIKIEGKAGRP